MAIELSASFGESWWGSVRFDEVWWAEVMTRMTWKSWMFWKFWKSGRFWNDLNDLKVSSWNGLNLGKSKSIWKRAVPKKSGNSLQGESFLDRYRKRSALTENWNSANRLSKICSLQTFLEDDFWWWFSSGIHLTGPSNDLSVTKCRTHNSVVT